MIGKTNALNGRVLKYASGTGRTAYTPKSINGFYFIYADITGLDFQPIFAVTAYGNSVKDVFFSVSDSTVSFNPDDMSKVLSLCMDQSTTASGMFDSAKELVESNIRTDGCVIPTSFNTSPYSSSNTYDCVWLAVGV